MVATVDLRCPYCGRIADARRDRVIPVAPGRYAHRDHWIAAFEAALRMGA